MESSSLLRNTAARWLWIGALVLGASSFFAWQHFYPVQAARGWSLEVYGDDMDRVRALVMDGEQRLYVSQEFKDGQGFVLSYSHDGKKHKAVTGLSKPDGMVAFDGGIAIGQEGGKLPVVLLREGKTQPLFVADSVEGLASDGRFIFAIEDVKQGGRLLKFDPLNHELTALRDDLEEGEGVAACPDGRLLYTEKRKGWIKQFRPGQGDDIVVRGLRDPSFLMCNDEGLWITEDRTHLARLLLVDATGKVQTILRHLRAPQTIIETAPARYLVAEQGRGRILQLGRSAPG